MLSELLFRIFPARQADEIAAAPQRLDGQGWKNLIESALQRMCGPLLQERPL